MKDLKHLTTQQPQKLKPSEAFVAGLGFGFIGAIVISIIISNLVPGA